MNPWWLLLIIPGTVITTATVGFIIFAFWLSKAADR